MSKQKILIVVLLVAILVSGAVFLLVWKNLKLNQVGVQPGIGENSDTETIGGQRDVHGCLVPAGYSWDEDLEVCLRTWEVNEEVRLLIKRAMEKTEPEYGLTFISALQADCTDCAEDGPKGYKLKFQIGEEFITVDLDSGSGYGGSGVLEEDLKEGWTRYTDQVNKFTLVHPETYKVTDDRYGWPKAVLILYNGGQSYDLVVEKWSTAQEYQDKYKNTKNLSVFKIPGGYLTAMNQNFDPEVEEIIATFKILK